MFDLFQNKVSLKNGKEGKITGVNQDDLSKPVQYLVEYWNENGKQQSWFYAEDFTVIK